MAEENNNQGPAAPTSNGAVQAEQPPARLSLRETAEAAWDEVEAAAEEGSEEGQPLQGDRARDSLGRFAAKDQAAQPGEAAPQGTQPRPEVSAPAQQPEPHPAPEGSSSAAPANWPAEARTNFEKLTPEMKSFVLERHSSMEADYQRRVQANATAAQFTAALAPVFQEPAMAGSLQQFGMSPFDAIREWAGFHRRAIDPNPAVRMQLLQEFGQRMGLDPAANGQGNQPGPGQLSEADLKDPAIRYFADHIGRTSNEVQALRGALQQLHQQDAERQNAEVLKVTRWGIDSFAEEKGSDGQPSHPHFDAVLPQLIELFRANPDRDIKEAYETACWMVPQVRSTILSQQQAAAQRVKDNERAKQAVRSNARGITSPVAAPGAGTEKRGLRATLEASADEVGI